MSKIALVSPNLVAQISDPMTTGIVYMPVSLAYFAGTLKQQGHQLQVIDAFGENPNRIKIEEDFIIRGLTPFEVAEKIQKDTQIIFLYAINLTYHRSVASLIKSIKTKFPKVPLVILENTQAVTAYSLRFIRNELYDLGADFILTGEAELRGSRLIEAAINSDLHKAGEIDGVGFRNNGVDHYTLPKEKITKLDDLAFAAWEEFPLQNYWSLRYSHGPQTTAKYLPLLTSRGCPYSCKFCVIPETNHLKWRARSAKSVVDEISYYKEKFGVTEFHIEDVDPTIDDKRTQAICQELIDRKLNINWKICAGT